MLAWIAGAIGSGLIAWLAYRRRSLSASGVAAAIVVGTALVGLGSAAWFGTLLAFFISSTALSAWKKHRRAEAETGYAKSGRRDAGQVAANGGAAVLLCAAHALGPHPLWWAAFVGALAAANADTWATELGGLSARPPRSVLSGRQVAPGTSGGVTAAGTAAAACGGLFVGAAAWALLALWPQQLGASVAAEAPASLAALTLLGLGGGLIGAFADSLLGAWRQRMQRCRVCGREVEAARHCGEPTDYARGWRWLGNDAVNALATLVGAGTAALLALAL